MSTSIYTSKNVKSIFTQHILKPNTDGKFPSDKYETVLVIPKTDDVTLTRFKKGVDEEIAAYLAKEKLKAVPKDYHNPLVDGDEAYQKDADRVENGEKDDDWLKNQAYKKGNFLLKTASKNKPQIVDSKGQPLTELNYNVIGQWALSLSYYKVSSENQGITVYLDGAMIVQNGTQRDVTSGFDFEDEDEEAFA